MADKLHNLMVKLTEWCQRKGIDYRVVCAEDNLRGIAIARRHHTAIPRLARFLAPLLARDGIHERAIGNRHGTTLLYALASIGEDVVMRFVDDSLPKYVSAVDAAFLEPLRDPKEGRYAFPSRRATLGRSTWPNFSNNESRLPTRTAIAEALRGIAANYDPNEAKQALGNIMHSLGLDAALQQSGIKNKVSDDGQYVIFYNVDRSGQPQPIIRYELAELGEESKMYEALDFLSDLAKKEAPGTGKQEREQQKQKEQAMRQLIKSKLPRKPEDDPVATGGQSVMQPAQPQIQPIGGARGGGFPAMPEHADRVTGVNFRGRVAAALLE